MNAVAERPEAVDTLSAWLTAYLAAPETADKTYFTVFDLLQAAGMPSDSQCLAAMARAADGAGLVKARRADGALLRAWHRPAALRAITNPKGEPTGHFTGRCGECGSANLWDDNSAYGCNSCGEFWTGIEPRLVPNGNAILPRSAKPWAHEPHLVGIDPGAADGDTTVLSKACHESGKWRVELNNPVPFKFAAADVADIKAFLTKAHDDLYRPRPDIGDALALAFVPHTAPSLDDHEARARERLKAYIDSAADWELMAYRIETRDIRDRADEAIARHRRVAKAVLRRLDPTASGDPAPRIVDIGGGLFDAFYVRPAMQEQYYDRRAKPRAGDRP